MERHGVPGICRWWLPCYRTLWVVCLGVTLFVGLLSIKDGGSKDGEGDKIDCIKITEQPALGHPLLRNHTIQMLPSSYPEATDKTRTRAISILKPQTRHRCPQGTVPVSRNVPKAANTSAERLNPGRLQPPRPPGDESTFEPKYRNMVDNHEEAGCYNLKCPGFIQTNNDFLLDFVIEPYSSHGGRQYYITIEIFMDNSTGDWWLYVQDKLVGYWREPIAGTVLECPCGEFRRR